MNEEEKAELFNDELERLLAGKLPDAESCDPGAIKLAAEFVSADFSDDSRIRETLGQKLKAGRRPAIAELLRGLLLNNYARAAAAAACLALAALPFFRTGGRAPASGEPALPAPARTPVAALSPAPAAQPAAPVFRAVPMAPLRGEPLAEFPIRTGSGAPIALAEGRSEASGGSGSAVLWETESGTFALERRSVKPEELFEIRSI